MVRSWTALLLAASALTRSSARAASSYHATDVFDSSNFFAEFDFFTQPDPTNGFVQYVDAETANRDGLAGYAQAGVYLGVDSTNTTTTGRASVRVTSKKAYTKGLFIADIAHMPAGATNGNSCGLWPAFWMFGPNWPNSGEIDIIEGVNTQASNAVTLHTGAGCSVTNAGSLAGTKLASPSCHGAAGCSQTTHPDARNYGAAFNAAAGGLYALEWTDDTIKVWFFPRNSTTAALLSNNPRTTAPDPSTFGPPLAAFVGGAGCPIAQHFANHRIVFDTTFCGDWAGRVWAADKTCAALAPTCEAYVGGRPGAFAHAYWLVRSVRVFERAAGGRAARQVYPAAELGREI
ncbi:glycoside hydrolase family 16 protein [Trichocladium antarcticum]|uniref:endo-1,3(4)-beta-glucanase n=1 Tax=Trichocladium antarcticum TaxID=1450529 RepID=A0AAN6UH19_9PEZI|nr:glycoside hydrolase family 16 protein [Trichocladium antarcticum]